MPGEGSGRERKKEWEEKEEKKRGSQGSFVFAYKPDCILVCRRGVCMWVSLSLGALNHSVHQLLVPPYTPPPPRLFCVSVAVNGSMAHPLCSPEHILSGREYWDTKTKIHSVLFLHQDTFHFPNHWSSPTFRELLWWPHCRLKIKTQCAKLRCSTTSPLGGSVGFFISVSLSLYLLLL